MNSGKIQFNNKYFKTGCLIMTSKQFFFDKILNVKNIYLSYIDAEFCLTKN